MSEIHRIDRNLQWAISADLAVTSKQSADASAIRAFAIDYENHLYLGELVHLRGETPEIVEEMCDLCARYADKNEVHAIQLFLEKGVILNAVKPQLEARLLERDLSVSITPVHAPGDKQAKARVLQARMQLGRVYHLAGEQFQNVVLPEYLGFGAGAKHDDIVDADAMAAYVIEEGIVPTPPEIRGPDEDYDEHHLTYEQMLERTTQGASERRRYVPKRITGEERPDPKKLKQVKRERGIRFT